MYFYVLKKLYVMKQVLFIFFSLFAVCSPVVSQEINFQHLKPIEKDSAKYADIALQIWEYAEVGYQEYKSSALLQQTLRDAGFTVAAGVAGMPTAFTAEAGSGRPVIGILGEFDALPGVSQTAAPVREERTDVNAGHACGHHLFGTASTAAAIAIQQWLQQTGRSGTIRYYGTPAEEGGGGKIYMVRAGLFKDVDAVIHWHPASSNGADAASSLSNISAKFRFSGMASHASSGPHFGRSALDGVEAMNFMVNLMREHIPQESRIHYVITHGGEAPNVVPEFAEVYYYSRHPEMYQAKENFEWIVEIAHAAAKGTQTKMEYEIINGVFNVLPNETLSKVMYKNLNALGGITYNEDEAAYAARIRETLMNPDANFENARIISPFKVIEMGTGGSTDVGDISWNVPTVGLRIATWVPGTSGHSWQAVAAGGTSIGIKGMLLAAKTMTLTAIDLFSTPQLLTNAQEELIRRRGGAFDYQPLIGDRLPPLDYRDE